MIEEHDHEYRSGIGADIHELVAGMPLMLGGVYIPYPSGLSGYSDGDVAEEDAEEEATFAVPILKLFLKVAIANLVLNCLLYCNIFFNISILLFVYWYNENIV